MVPRAVTKALLCCTLTLVLRLNAVSSAPAADEVTSLPGWSGALPSRIYSGHIPAGWDVQDGVNYTMYMWYMFVECASVEDPTTAPIVSQIRCHSLPAQLLQFMPELRSSLCGRVAMVVVGSVGYCRVEPHVSVRSCVRSYLQVLWSNGGPGASSAFGLFAEMGPFYLDYSSLTTNPPTLYANNYSWSLLSNVLILNGPAP